MAGAGLVLLVALLLLLHQNLVVMLGAAAAYVHLVFGDGRLTDIVVDVWDAANKDVLLSIPLYLLAGNVMSRGVMATRLIRLMRAVTAPVIATVVTRLALKPGNRSHNCPPSRDIDFVISRHIEDVCIGRAQRDGNYGFALLLAADTEQQQKQRSELSELTGGSN